MVKNEIKNTKRREKQEDFMEGAKINVLHDFIKYWGITFLIAVPLYIFLGFWSMVFIMLFIDYVLNKL